MSKAKAFIFDLDGTLVDALPDIRANANRALEALGYDLRLSLDETRPHVGGGAHKLASNVLGLPMDHPETMALYHKFAEIYEQHPADHGVPFPQVMETLTAMKERGIPMCCVTAKPAIARVKVLDAMGITPFLVHALSPEDGFAKKPAPDMLWECCRKMGVKPEETWMVGDTLFDIEAGLNAGCQGVAFVPHGYQQPPAQYLDRIRVLASFDELLTLA